MASQHVLAQAGRPGYNVFRPEPEVFQNVGPAKRARTIPPPVRGQLHCNGRYSESNAARLFMESTRPAHPAKRSRSGIGN